MKNEVMTNGCSKDHTKEGATCAGRRAIRPPGRRGPWGPQAPRPGRGKNTERKKRGKEGTTGTEQDRTGQGPNPPGKKEGKSEERREQNRGG